MDNAAATPHGQILESEQRQFSHVFAAAVRRHRYIHALAFSSLALAAAVGAKTGNMPDFGVLTSFGSDIFIVLWVCGCIFGLYRLYQLGIVQRDPAPLSAFVRSFAKFLSERSLIANAVNGMAAMIAFATAFGVLKGAVALLVPFGWDPMLASLDRTLHFGREPYEWLGWITGSPLALRVINIAYNLWFVVLVGSMWTASIARQDTRLRHQFLMSLILVWIGGGFFVAMGFSSAGPCYFAKLGYGSNYQPLMDALASANTVYSIWAVPTQQMLWDGYTGVTAGSIGISAFPSMHVATAVLFAIYASCRSPIAGALLWAFAGVIMIGSIVLGWHYAVDGYGGALFTVLVWKSVGYFLDRFTPEGLAG